MTHRTERFEDEAADASATADVTAASAGATATSAGATATSADATAASAGGPPADATRSRVSRPARRGFDSVILALFCLVLFTAGNSRVALFDRDEPRFAQASREMIESGNWLTAQFAGEPRYDKPILIYWLMSLSYAVLEVNEFAARLPSALCGALACVAAGWWGVRHLRRRAGMAAGWILATCLLTILESKAATADACLLLWMVLALRGLYEVTQQTDRPIHRLTFWTALALATLTKGPVAPAFVFLTAASWGVFTGEWAVFRRLRFRTGIPLYLALLLPWVVAASVTTQGGVLSVGLGHHVIRRSLEPLEGHRGFPGFYLFTPLLTFFPWVFLLPAALLSNWKTAWRRPDRLFLAAVWAGPFLMFELVQTKLVHYMLPAFPALAILLAEHFAACLSAAAPAGCALLRRCARAAAVVLFAVFIVLVLQSGPILDRAGLASLEKPAFQTIAALLLLTGTGFALIAGGRLRGGLACVAAGPAVFTLLLALVLAPPLRLLQPAPDAARVARELAGEGKAVAVLGASEPSVVYYLNPVRPRPDAHALADALRRGEVGAIVVEARERSDDDRVLSDDFGALGLALREAITGYNFARGELFTLHLYTPRPEP